MILFIPSFVKSTGENDPFVSIRIAKTETNLTISLTRRWLRIHILSYSRHPNFSGKGKNDNAGISVISCTKLQEKKRKHCSDKTIMAGSWWF